MIHALDSRSTPFDPKQGGLLLANMLSAWLDGEPSGEGKPRLVKVVVNARGTEPFSLGGFSREAVHYVAQVDLGGEVPVVLRSETLSYMGGPIWRMELVSPAWPQASAENLKKGTATER